MQLTPHRGGVAGVTYFGYSAFDVNICLIYYIIGKIIFEPVQWISND